ncbi:NADH dehydrogenase (ubiquinone) SGDH subunit [Lasioglossum baleicum]|uniref:NADH dehydrogenase (ubiquinone) SGDH subunit n=1 Tax=Lasioglossum baleicum TaxID=434251 RepID=UPI003FCC5D42
MATWSRLLFSTGQKFFKPNGLLLKTVPKNVTVRCMSEHRTMVVEPSNYQWHKLKDWFHFYFFVGLIPIAVLVSTVNTFIGPATLEPIPEGYIPKQYEYYRSPITRFIAKHFSPNQQQEYEKLLHVMVTGWELGEMRQLEYKVQKLIRENQDYRYFNFQQDYLGIDILRQRKRLEYDESHQ